MGSGLPKDLLDLHMGPWEISLTDANQIVVKLSIYCTKNSHLLPKINTKGLYTVFHSPKNLTALLSFRTGKTGQKRLDRHAVLSSTAPVL